MSSIDPNETDLDRYRQALRLIVNANPRSFRQISGHGVTLDLRESVPVVERIVGLFRRIRDSDLDAIPDSHRTQPAHEINRTLREFQRVRDLDPRNQSPEKILSSLRGVYQEVYTNLTPILAHVGTDPAGFDELRRQAETAGRSRQQVSKSAGCGRNPRRHSIKSRRPPQRLACRSMRSYSGRLRNNIAEHRTGGLPRVASWPSQPSGLRGRWLAKWQTDRCPTRSSSSLPGSSSSV